MTYDINIEPRSLIGDSTQDLIRKTLRSRTLGAAAGVEGGVEFDPEQADLQQILRNFHSAGPTGADYAASRIAETQKRAANTIMEHGAELTPEELERLSRIAATGVEEQPDQQGFWTGLLDAIDIPARLVRLAVADAFQWDQGSGVEIDRQAYQSALNPFDNPDDLADILGEDFVGEDGRFGGSKLLEAAGYDPYNDDDTSVEFMGISLPWSKREMGRFLADFATEVALDPLTYVTLGLSAAGKKAGTELVDAAVRKGVTQAAVGVSDDLLETGARTAAQALAKGAGENAPAYVQRLRNDVAQTAKRIFNERWQRETGTSVANVADLSAHERFRLMEEAADAAIEEVTRREINQIGEAVVNGRFNELRPDFAQFIKADKDLDNRLLGGVRVHAPRLLGGAGAPGGHQIPGTAGMARRLREATGLQSKIDKLAKTHLGTNLKKLKNSFATESAQVVAARTGKLAEFKEGPRQAQKLMQRLGVEDLAPDLHAAAVTLSKAAKAEGENADDVVRQLLDLMENPGGVSTIPFSGPELHDAAVEFIDRARRGMATLHDALKKLDPTLGTIDGYVPRLMSKQGRKAIAFLADEGVEIRGGSIGADLLRQLVAQYRAAAARNAGSVGETTFRETRELAQNAVVVLDEAGHVLLTPDMTISGTAKGFLSIGELNDEVGRAMRNAITDNNLGLKFGDEAKLWEDNPQTVLGEYFKGMEQAIRERAMIQAWENVGLIRKGSRDLDIGRTASRLVGVYNQKVAQQVAARYHDLTAGVQLRNRVAEGLEAIPTTKVDLGHGVEIDLPTSVVERPRIQQLIGRAKEKMGQAARHRDEIIAQQKVVYNELVADGVSEALAHRLSIARAHEMTKLKHQLWAEAVESANNELDVLTEIIVRDYSIGDEVLTNVRQGALDRAARERNKVKQAREQLDAEWEARYADEGAVEANEVQHTFTPTDFQGFVARASRGLQSLSEEYLNLLDVPESVRGSLAAAVEMGDNALFEELLVRYTNLETSARAVRVMHDWLIDAAESGSVYARKVLDSERHMAKINRADRWLRNPTLDPQYSSSASLADEFPVDLWEEFMLPYANMQANTILTSRDFLRAVGSFWSESPDNAIGTINAARQRWADLDEAIEQALANRRGPAKAGFDANAARKARNRWANDSRVLRPAVEARLRGEPVENPALVDALMGWFAAEAEGVTGLKRAMNAEEVARLESLEPGSVFEIAMASADEGGLFATGARKSGAEGGGGWLIEFEDGTRAAFNELNQTEPLRAAQQGLDGGEWLVSGRFTVDSIDETNRVVRLSGQQPLWSAADDGAEQTVREVYDDWLIERGMAQVAVFKQSMETAGNRRISTFKSFDSDVLAMVRMASVDPAIVNTQRFRDAFLRLVDFVGFDPDRIRFVDGEVQLLAPRTVEANFPTLKEVTSAVEGTGAKSFASMTEKQRNALPENVRKAIETQGVPAHIEQHERLGQWYAAARRSSNRAGSAARRKATIEASEKVWNDTVLPGLRKVLAGDAKPDWLRSKLYLVDSKTNKLVLTDEGRALKRGMPDREWDALKYELDYLEALNRPDIPRALLRANHQLMSGRMFLPYGKAVERLEKTADEIALTLNETERVAMEKQLQQLDNFTDLLTERLLPGRAMTDAGEGVRPIYPDSIQGDALFERDLATARKIAKRLKLDTEDALKPVRVGATSTRGFASVGVVGVGGDALAGKIADEPVRILLENMAANLRTLYTPQGVESVKSLAGTAVRWWKGMVTVTRPTFHLRNFMGALWNNQIADVGAREYALVGRHAPGLLRKLRRGATVEEALATIKNDEAREIFRAMIDHKVLENSFAQREFGQIGTGGATALQRVSPFSGDPEKFFLVAGGALAMESIEGFMRAAAFARHYRSGAEFAVSMVNAVHFDYSDLSKVEEWVKTISPFFVWTRRNIPLQMRALLERPGIMARYESLMGTVDDHASMLDQDQYPTSPYLSPGAARTDVILGEDTPFWARLLFDPDIPTANLMELDPLSPSSWVDFVMSSLGPQFTMPLDLREQAEWNYDVNAPAGLNEILRILNVGTQTPQGDAQIPYWTRSLFEGVLPFYREWVDTPFPRDPNRAAALGVNRTDGTSIEESARAALLKGLGAFGVTAQTPAQTPSQTFAAGEAITGILNQAETEGRIEPEIDLESVLAQLDISP